MYVVMEFLLRSFDICIQSMYSTLQLTPRCKYVYSETHYYCIYISYWKPRYIYMSVKQLILYIPVYI